MNLIFLLERSALPSVSVSADASAMEVDITSQAPPPSAPFEPSASASPAVSAIAEVIDSAPALVSASAPPCEVSVQNLQINDVLALLDACGQTGDYVPAIRQIGALFSDADALDRSFFKMVCCVADFFFVA